MSRVPQGRGGGRPYAGRPSPGSPYDGQRVGEASNPGPAAGRDCFSIFKYVYLAILYVAVVPAVAGGGAAHPELRLHALMSPSDVSLRIRSMTHLAPSATPMDGEFFGVEGSREEEARSPCWAGAQNSVGRRGGLAWPRRMSH